MLALSYGLLAYAIHKVGVIMGFYYTFFWFQLLTHFLSSTALVLLLLVAGRTIGLEATGLVAFVVGAWLVGILSWELVEYLDLVPWLIWWGIGDFLVDLASDTVGLVTVFLAVRVHGGVGPVEQDPVPSISSRGD
jgi:hypothetical protein